MHTAVTLYVENLKAEFKRDLADRYPQYNSLLGRKPLRLVQAKKDYSGGRVNDKWYNKGDILLAFGPVEEGTTWSYKTKSFSNKVIYITVYSRILKGLCRAPFNHFDVLTTLEN